MGGRGGRKEEISRESGEKEGKGWGWHKTAGA